MRLGWESGVGRERKNSKGRDREEKEEKRRKSNVAGFKYPGRRRKGGDRERQTGGGGGLSQNQP